MGRTARVTREQVLTAAREEGVTHGYAGATLAAIGCALLWRAATGALQDRDTPRSSIAAAGRVVAGLALLGAGLSTAGGGSPARAGMGRAGRGTVGM